MAAKKKRTAKKAKKKTGAAKAKRAPAKKSKAKKARKMKAPAKKTVKAVARKVPAKKKQTVGEGDYAASKSFLKDQSSFVEKNKAKIAGLGKAAEKALEGPEGDGLREAEATAATRSRDIF
jgi:hypothetical protein